MRRLVACAVALACLAPPADAVARDATWPERVRRAQAWAEDRAGSVSFQVVDPRGRSHGVRAAVRVPMASTIKVMFLVAYLRTARDRSLRARERAMLGPMIRRSSDAQASRVADLLGAAALRRLGRDAGMREFSYTRPWGLSTTSARDQAAFLRDLDAFVPGRHERYARRLLASIVRPQRWGIARIDLGRWDLFFKGGWGSGSGAVDHQVALLERGEDRIGVAIMTTSSPSHGYGKRTLLGVARRLLRGR